MCKPARNKCVCLKGELAWTIQLECRYGRMVTNLLYVDPRPIREDALKGFSQDWVEGLPPRLVHVLQSSHKPAQQQRSMPLCLPSKPTHYRWLIGMLLLSTGNGSNVCPSPVLCPVTHHVIVCCILTRGSVLSAASVKNCGWTHTSVSFSR